MQLIFKRQDGTSLDFVEKTIRNDGFIYARVKFHVERYGQSILYYPDTFVATAAGGIPSVMQTMQTAKDLPVTMTKDLQLWSYELMKRNAPSGMTEAEIKKCWYHTYTSDVAFANKSGPDWLTDDGVQVYADWVNGTNTGAAGWKLAQTISHGATVKVLRVFEKQAREDGMPTRVINVAAIETADAFDPKTLSLNYETSPHLLMCAVNWSRGRRADGTLTPGYKQGWAEPFPKLGGKNVIVPRLVNHATEEYIEQDWLEYISPQTAIPTNPYWKNNS